MARSINSVLMQSAHSRKQETKIFASKEPLSERPRVLLIDNFDSFTYNLAHLFAKVGAEVIVERNNAINLEQARRLSPDAIIISPGPGSPENEKDIGISLPIIRELHRELPILGVCLGHQAIIHAFGGKIVRAKNLMHGKTSEIEHIRHGVFYGIPSPVVGMRYHSLVGEKSSIPGCLEITAASKDDEEIMAVQHKHHPLFGVQFHPESILSESGEQLAKNFLAYARIPYYG